MAKEEGIVDSLNKLCVELGVGKGELIDGSCPTEIAEMVDLDIAHKLLIVEQTAPQDEFGLFCNPPDVTKDITKRPDGQYEIRWTSNEGPDFKIVSDKDMKVMRARFLLLRGFYMQNFESLTLPKQNEVAAMYDIHYIPKF